MGSSSSVAAGDSSAETDSNNNNNNNNNDKKHQNEGSAIDSSSEHSNGNDMVIQDNSHNEEHNDLLHEATVESVASNTTRTRINQYHIIQSKKLLGTGASSSVVLAKDTTNGEMRAMKKMRTADLRKIDKQVQD